jgi:hypothetical protein
MGPGSDLLESPLEDLLTVIRQTLEKGRAPKTAASPPSDLSAVAPPGLPTVYFVYDEVDAAAVLPWADFLFEQNVEVVHPVFQGGDAEILEFHQENLRGSDGVVIFAGAASAVWLNRKLGELQNIAPAKKKRVDAVCLLPPKTLEKERFRTHKAIVLRQWEGLSPDSWQSILALLKG